MILLYTLYLVREGYLALMPRRLEEQMKILLFLKSGIRGPAFESPFCHQLARNSEEVSGHFSMCQMRSQTNSN